MKKRLFFLWIVLALTIGMGVPTSTAAADGAKQVDFTATSTSLCGTGDPRCYAGDFDFNHPSGKILISGYKEAMLFTASDPRWNAECVFSANLIRWNETNVPIMGTFVCTATDPDYAGGRWEGALHQVAHNQAGTWMAVWNAKGYGAFDGLMTTVYNNFSSKYDDQPAELNNIGVIIELPEYQR